MAPAPVPVPAPPPAMDTNKDEGDGGGAKNQSSMVVDEGDVGAKNQNSLVVVKSEAVCTKGGPLVVGTELVKYEGGDTTECSSSFGDTFSGFEGEADNGEPEVNSGMSAHANGVGPSKPPRRKKVTAEWNNSVRPIQWRCHWLELRMRELSSEVSKYDRELAVIKKQKESHQAVSKANGTMSESTQIHKGHGNSIMKRRKRKRHEENMDASLYINKHRILSYYHDKQNKGAETDGVLVDGDCGTVDGSIGGGLDTATLLDSEDYGMICEQRTLQDILLSIDGVQSRVHLLQERLNKAHSEGENLAFSGGDTHFRVARKRQRTQKHSVSYTQSRHTKPQKKKNLNILLKDDDGQALSGGSALPDRETDAHIIGTSGSTEERSGECNHLRDKAITFDLLLGTGNSIPNSDIGDLYNVNTDDVLIDNKAANEACEHFHKAKHLPSGSCSKDQNIFTLAEMKNNSPLVEVKNTCAPLKVESICAPVEVDSTSTPALEQEPFLEKSPSRKLVSSPGNKQEIEPKKRRKKKGSFFTKKQRKEVSKTPDAKEKTEGMSSAAKNKRSTTSDVGKEKTESTLSAATGPSGKKRKSGNEPADAKKHRSLNSSLASKEQKTGKPSSAVKKQKTEKSTAAAKVQKAENAGSATNKQETESSSSTEKKLETSSAPLKLQVGKAVLVAVNSRRSQRVRKPKVFAE